MKKAFTKKRIIIIGILLLFFIINTITYKGYYYSVDHRFLREKVVFLNYNKAYNETLLYTEKKNKSKDSNEPLTIKEKSKYNVNVINILNTFYIVSNKEIGPVYHFHIFGLDIMVNRFSKNYNKSSYSTPVTLLFYQGRKRINTPPDLSMKRKAINGEEMRV